MAQIPNLSFGLWMSRMSIGEIISSDTTSEKKKKSSKTSAQLFLARRFCGVRSFRAPLFVGLKSVDL